MSQASPVTVKRWRRYGKDRLYVNGPGGARLGWVDLATGETVLDREDARAEFEAAVAKYWEERGEAAPQPADECMAGEGGPGIGQPSAGAASPAVQEPYAVTVAWRDLARNRPGQAAREQAVAHRRAAPLKTLATRLLGVHTDERAWRVGSRGEEKVGAELERLPELWTTLHALPVGDRGADIDHLVVGPPGVFTANTKHHPDASVWVGGGTFLVNGHRQPYVRNARHEARRASRLLSAASGADVRVTGVIVVVGAHQGFTVKAQPDGVHVVARKQIVRWLLSLPARLSEQQVRAVAAAARRSDTWQAAG